MEKTRMSRSRSLLALSLFLVLVISAAAHGGDGGGDATPADAHGSIRSRPLVLVKVWCLLVIFVGTFLPGISPYFFKWNDGFLVLGTQFAGGVFLGTSMMHFLSDANKTFQDLTTKQYPFAFMLACAGYLLTMFADCLISYLFSKQSAGDVEVQGGVDQGKTGHRDVNSPSKLQVSNGAHHPHLAVSRLSSLGDSILLILALCFHSVFEGIAIGVAETKADAWKALWTISIHKVFAAIAMGIALLRMMPNRPLLSCAAYAFAFAISSPIGVAIGIAIDTATQKRVSDWVYAISMGLACGVFIYVSINHLLAKGYKSQKPTLADTPFHKSMAVLLGVAVIAVVMIWDA